MISKYSLNTRIHIPEDNVLIHPHMKSNICRMLDSRNGSAVNGKDFV